MRVLLQDRSTGLFYGGNEHWVCTQSDALDFQEPHRAETVRLEQHLPEAEVILDSTSPGLCSVFNGRNRARKQQQMVAYRGSIPQFGSARRCS